jgi:hypothetical protein
MVCIAVKLAREADRETPNKGRGVVKYGTD